jgi:ABC-2 type transport system permease protein
MMLYNGFGYGIWLAKSIKTGTLSSDLVRPVPILSYTLASRIGDRLPVMILSVISVAIGLAVSPEVKLPGVFIAIAAMLCGFAVSVSINILIGTLAFITPEIQGYKNAISHVARFFSGLAIPLAFFPTAVRWYIELLPFAAPISTPIMTLRQGPSRAIGWALLASLVWALALSLLTRWHWHYQLRRYDAVGI